MTVEELQRFLGKEQAMGDVSLQDCKSLVDAFEQSELKASGRISILGESPRPSASRFRSEGCLWSSSHLQLSGGLEEVRT